ncbi:hypothetical protein EXU85_03670 [Spirosoma sp. KCTC 42546]|uniref:hypothetical protein n=1 Tax=Spirosoma sp. KCTC 42546 TaxID=2520506 RepID=UPI001159CAD4|nr:hypothetical protein [Spirosoma sp. KCTC 42546]QDK77741.1 hypothetical protein EXU85_03670 [Spirosoma sp. KCTC 42546]
MTYQTLQYLSQILVLIGLILAALGGYGSFHYGQEIEKEKSKKENVKPNSSLKTNSGHSNPEPLIPSGYPDERKKNKNFQVRGYIYESESKHAIEGVEVSIGGITTRTDHHGFFDLSVNGKKDETKMIHLQKEGYRPIFIRIPIPQDNYVEYLNKEIEP